MGMHGSIEGAWVEASSQANIPNYGDFEQVMILLEHGYTVSCAADLH